MTSDRIHAGLAKVQKPAALVDLDDRDAVFEIPARHGVGPVVRGCDPGRTNLLQFGLRAVHDLLITRLAADRIGLADQVPGADDIIKKQQNDEDDTGNIRRVSPPRGATNFKKKYPNRTITQAESSMATAFPRLYPRHAVSAAPDN